MNAVSMLLDDWLSQEGDDPGRWVPRVAICAHRCPVLVEALRGGYQYEAKGGELASKPKKDRFSDVADALSSAALMINQVLRKGSREASLTPHDDEWWGSHVAEDEDLW